MTSPAAIRQAAFVRKMGEGERNLLALHCTIGHSGAWTGLSNQLDGAATLVAPDMLSHGRSPDWDGQSDFVDEITALAKAQLTEPMDVIGHSLGAMIALRLSVDHPELVRSAVLIEPVFFALARQDAPDLLDQHERAAIPIADAFAKGDKPSAARLFNRLWSTQSSPRWPDLPDRTRSAMIRGIDAVPAIHDTLYNDSKGLLDPDRLKRASMPVLLLSGSESQPVMPAICDGLSKRLPNATRADVDGAGHMLPISHPRETAELVQEFWRSTALQ